MDFRILGPLEVLDEGRPLDLGATKQRALLAVLTLNANRVVSSDRLIESLWGERAPDTALKALQVYVSQLRKVLGKDRIRTRAPGYELRLEPDELDLHRFENLVTGGRFGEALEAWRGAPLADFAYEPFAQAEIARLEELRLTCLEQRFEEDLAAGRRASLVGELEALVHERPLRERLRAQLMLALYRSGRQAEALDVYQAGRTLLAEELGLEPGAELRELQRAILVQNASLDLHEPPVRRVRTEPEAPPAAEISPPREVRKTVTVLYCDLALLGAPLDPESLRRMTARGFEQLVPVLEHHGATVERSIGGAIAAIFGIPTIHEDDAFRATRAAVEVRERLAGLRDELEETWNASLDLRAGISTGEVVTGGGADQPFATGDSVQLAVRLQQLAEPGQVLVDARTLERTRELVDAESLGQFNRLVGIRAGAQGYRSRFDSPMVGRERERRRLHDAFGQAAGDRSCQLFTILGAPGVGKSRLVSEFVAELSDRALVAHGRCLPYGEGITYWPVLEAVRDSAGLDDSESGDESLRKLEVVVADEDDADIVVQRLAEVLGLTQELSGAEETFWAVRTFFEALARRRPLVLVFDDIHWGEATFLDLVDHVSDWARGAPILLVCVARPELLDARPHWGGGKLNATSILLEPLSEAESVQLVNSLAAKAELDAAAKQRIVAAADGNPLFVEEMLALLMQDGRSDATLEVPPTIQALLAARLDRLGEQERSVIEAAAVEGKIFHEGSIVELLSIAPSAVSDALMTLARRELIRPERPVFSGERAYLFRHILIRDAAYESLPKEARATFHERHASWLEQKVGDRALEFEEIVGYHLEQAFRYRSELGRADERARELAVRAGRRLGVAGRRALARGDTTAAINLAARAAALLPSDDPLRVHLIPGVRAVQGLGDQLAWAAPVLHEAMATGDPGLQGHARVQEAFWRLFTEPSVDVDELVHVANDSIELFETLEDELGIARSWRLLQQARYLGRQAAASADAAEEALLHARRTDDPVEETEIIAWLGIALYMGATHAAEAERRLHSHLGNLRGSRTAETLLQANLAPLKAMQGRISEGRELLEQGKAVVEDLGILPQLAVVPFCSGITELLAGDPVAAERVLRSALRPLEEAGETSNYCSIVAVLAQAVYEQGRYEEAEKLTAVSEQASRLNDIHAQTTWRPTRAKALARRGEFAEAERIAQEAIAFAADSDFLNAHGYALLDLAEVQDLAGRSSAGRPAVEDAIALFERKGNVLAADRARAVLEELGAGV